LAMLSGYSALSGISRIMSGKKTTSQLTTEFALKSWIEKGCCLLCVGRDREGLLHTQRFPGGRRILRVIHGRDARATFRLTATHRFVGARIVGFHGYAFTRRQS